MTPDAPQVGDILLVSTRLDPFALAIKATQLLAGYPEWRVHHWQIVTEVHDAATGDVSIVEASIRGVRERRIRLRGREDFMRPDYAAGGAPFAIIAARAWVGKRYGLLNILVLLMWILDYAPAWARRVAEDLDNGVVCSQLGALAAKAGGDHNVVSWFYWIPAMYPGL